MPVIIHSKEPAIVGDTSVQEGWFVDCTVDLPDGCRSGPHHVNLPAEATDEQLQAAVLALYGA